MPSTNGHGSARGLARFYAALLEPDRILSPDLRALAAQPHSSGPCTILGDDVAFGLGFAHDTPATARAESTQFRALRHGRRAGFRRPGRRNRLGYVMNHVIPRWQSTRNRALIDSLY